MKSKSKAKQDTGHSQVIRLVKIKQWYVPYSGNDYIALVGLGVTSTKIHEDLIDSVKLVASKKGLVIRGRHFQNVLDSFLESIETQWFRHPYRTAKFTKKRLKFATTKAEAFKRAKTKSIPSIELKLRDFFQRWGLGSEFVYSEHREQAQLVVDYWISDQRMPVIPVKSDPVVDNKATLELGSHRLVVWVDKHRLYWELNVKSGLEWAPKTSGTCSRDEVSNPHALLGVLVNATTGGQAGSAWDNFKLDAETPTQEGADAEKRDD